MPSFQKIDSIRVEQHINVIGVKHPLWSILETTSPTRPTKSLLNHEHDTSFVTYVILNIIAKIRGRILFEERRNDEKQRIHGIFQMGLIFKESLNGFIQELWDESKDVHNKKSHFSKNNSDRNAITMVIIYLSSDFQMRLIKMNWKADSKGSLQKYKVSNSDQN